MHCSFDRELHDKKSATYKDLFRRKTANVANVKVLDITDLFCDEKACHAENSEGLLYASDNNHLSLRGARIVDREIMSRYPDQFIAR